MFQDEVAGRKTHLLQFDRRRLDLIDFSGGELPVHRLVPVGLCTRGVIRQPHPFDLAPPLRAGQSQVPLHYSPPPSPPPCAPPSPPCSPLSPLPKPPRTTSPLSPETTTAPSSGSLAPASTVSPTLPPLAPPYT